MVPPEEDPTFIKLSELDSRLARVERVVDSEGLVNILKRIEQLQSDSQVLRGQIETLQFQLEQANTGQKQQYQDVDRRLQGIEKSVSERSGAQSDGTSVLDGKELKAGQLPVPGGSDRANYQAAFELLKQGRHKEANAALRQFMVAFPRVRCSITRNTGWPKPITSVSVLKRRWQNSRLWSTSIRSHARFPMRC
jgi:TolA-binding protein